MIPLYEPYISTDARRAASGTMKNGIVGATPQSYLYDFEHMLASHFGFKRAFAVLTGTIALELTIAAVLACREPKAKSAHFCTMTFIATAAACCANGLKCKLVDCISSGTNWSPDFHPIHIGKTVIIDAAPAVGRAIPKCTAATLSFNANKIITTGQGGAILVNDDQMIEWIADRLDLCKEKPTSYVHWHRGYNYRMSNINAAVGAMEFSMLDERLAGRKMLIDRYRSAGLDMLDTLWQALWLLPRPSALHVADMLRRSGIGSKSFWCPMHMQPAAPFLNIKHKGLNLRNSEDLYYRTVMIPSSPSLTDDQQDKVIRACERYL